MIIINIDHYVWLKILILNKNGDMDENKVLELSTIVEPSRIILRKFQKKKLKIHK